MIQFLLLLSTPLLLGAAVVQGGSALPPARPGMPRANPPETVLRVQLAAGVTANSFCSFGGELAVEFVSEFRAGPVSFAYTLGADIPNVASAAGVVTGESGDSGYVQISNYVIQDDGIGLPGGTVFDKVFLLVRADKIAPGNRVWVTRHLFITAPDEIGNCSSVLFTGGSLAGVPGNTVGHSATSDETQIILSAPGHVPGMTGTQYYQVGAGTFQGGGVASPSWDLPQVGSFRFGRSVTYIITPLNNPVPVIAPVWTATTSNSVDLDGSGSFDPDDSQTPGAGIVDLSWTIQDADAEFHFAGPLITYLWDSPGTYSVSLTAVDDEGEQSTASQYVVVSD